MNVSKASVPKDIASLEWLLGKWKSISGKVIYPTIDTVHYSEELEFSDVGQPLLMYSASSCHAEKEIPLHFERGFLRIKPDSNHIALLVAHNFGLTEISEGKVMGKKLVLETTSLSRTTFTPGSTVMKLQRTLELSDDGVLRNIVFMETETQPLQLHTSAEYQKVDT